jgi:integrase
MAGVWGCRLRQTARANARSGDSRESSGVLGEKTRQGRWVNVPPVLFEAVLALCPLDDRTAGRRVFQGFGADRFRTAIGRACVAVGVPVFSPHDVRHRRISLMHLAGVPWARIGEQVGQRGLAITANTYTHVLTDEAELDYANLVSGYGQDT